MERIPSGLSFIENDVHGTERLLVKTHVLKVKILHTEVNLIIYYSARSRWTKYQHLLKISAAVREETFYENPNLPIAYKPRSIVFIRTIENENMLFKVF